MKSRFRLRVISNGPSSFDFTNHNTKKFAKNWFCNEIRVQAKIPFQMDTKIISTVKQHFKLKIPFQKNKHYNRYIYNQVGVSKASFLHLENKS